MLILAACLALITSTDSRFFEPWENRAWDMRLRLAADPEQADPNIKLILVDQRSIEQIYEDTGHFWPFPRKQFSSLLSFLAAAGARGAAFDYIFSEQSFYGARDDQALAEGPAKDLKVVFAFSPQRNQRLLRRGKSEFEEKLAAALEHSRPYVRPAKNLTQYKSALLPLPEIIRSASGLGAVVVDSDSDGIIRRYPSAGLLLLEPESASGAGAQFESLDSTHDDSRSTPSELEAAPGLAEPAGWPFLSLSFSLYREVYGEKAWRTAAGSLAESAPLLNFHGGSGVYAAYSFSDVVQSWQQILQHQTPRINPAEFKNGLIFIGVWAPGLMDQRLTPLESRARAVDIHATALDNLIHYRFARKSSKASSFLISFLFLSMAVFSAILPRHLSVQLFGIAAATAGLIGIAIYAAQNGVWIELFGPLVIQTIAVITALAYEYAVEGRDHRFLKEAFRHYVSPSVIDSIVDDPSALALGGERRELTIFFSDIAGFIALSEKLDPALEAKLLNEYLSLCAETILEAKGTVDKFVGDGIVAFWNAPVHEPAHARLAVETAVAIQQKLKERADIWRIKYGTELATRIGLHTGPVNVGNFGANIRFSYTVIGDAANLASRLEGVNKVFGTCVILSAATHELIRHTVPCRRLGRMRVAGRSEPVEVFEPLAASALDSAGQAEVFEASVSSFESGRIADANAGFGKLATIDPASAAYLKRIAGLETTNKIDTALDCWDLTDK